MFGLDSYAFVDFEFGCAKSEEELKQIAAKTVKPDSRLKDPEKIAANIEEKTKAAVEKLTKSFFYSKLQKIYTIKLSKQPPLILETLESEEPDDEVIINKFADWIAKNSDKTLALFCLPETLAALWQHRIKAFPKWEYFDKIILPALHRGVNVSALFEPGRVFGVKNPDAVAEFITGKELQENASSHERFVWLASAAQKIIETSISTPKAVWSELFDALS